MHRGAVMAGSAALRDPRTACFYSRWTTEQAIKWAFAHDPSLPRPSDEQVSTMLHEPAFKDLMDDTVFRITREVIRWGNRAVHDARQPSQHESVAAVSHLFEF